MHEPEPIKRLEPVAVTAACSVRTFQVYIRVSVEEGRNHLIDTQLRAASSLFGDAKYDHSPTSN